MGGRGTKFDKKKDKEQRNKAANQRRMSGGGGGDAAGTAQGGGVIDNPVDFNDNFKVTRTVDADRGLRKFFGRDLSDTEVGRLVGAPDGADIQVSTNWNDTRVIFSTTHPLYGSYQTRALYRNDDGDLVMYNDYFRVRDDAPDGVGALVFSNQVSNARRLGVKKITVYAAGSYGDPDFNGYYVWAVFGYNMRFEGNEFASLPQAYRDAGIRTMHQLMSYKGKIRYGRDEFETGRDWWKRHGWGWDGEFDLTDGSASLDRLRDYLKSKNRVLPFKI